MHQSPAPTHGQSSSRRIDPQAIVSAAFADITNVILLAVALPIATTFQKGIIFVAACFIFASYGGLRRLGSNRVPSRRLLMTVDWVGTLAVVIIYCVVGGHRLAAIAPAAALITTIYSVVRFPNPGVLIHVLMFLVTLYLWIMLSATLQSELPHATLAVHSAVWLVVVLALILALRYVPPGSARLNGEPLSSRAASTSVTAILSPRELDILQLLARHDLRTYEDVGEQAQPIVSGRTVASHLRRIERKLGVRGGRWVVVRAARSRGILGSPPAKTRPGRSDSSSG